MILIVPHFVNLRLFFLRFLKTRHPLRHVHCQTFRLDFTHLKNLDPLGGCDALWNIAMPLVLPFHSWCSRYLIFVVVVVVVAFIWFENWLDSIFYLPWWCLWRIGFLASKTLISRTEIVLLACMSDQALIRFASYIAEFTEKCHVCEEYLVAVSFFFFFFFWLRAYCWDCWELIY